jgi:alpha-ribazole phosphatase
MIVYLVRHARPRGVDGICYGRSDIEVDTSETQHALQMLRRQIPEEILGRAPVYSSPLERCVGLAREIAAGRPVTLTPALLELDFGAWQGRSWDAIPRQELDAWAGDLWGYAPGQGENARAAAARWRSWVEGFGGETPDAVIAVTHAGLIRVALADLTMTVGYGTVHPIDVPTSRIGAMALEQGRR